MRLHLTIIQSLRTVNLDLQEKLHEVDWLPALLRSAVVVCAFALRGRARGATAQRLPYAYGRR